MLVWPNTNPKGFGEVLMSDDVGTANRRLPDS